LGTLLGLLRAKDKGRVGCEMEPLKPVLEELGLPDDASGVSVPRTVAKSRLLELMSSRNIDVLGAVYAFVMNRKDGRTVEPPLSFKDYQQFLLHYYERCFLEDPESAWADSRYSAGWDLVNWFGVVWRDEKAPPSALAEIKTLVAKLYRNGDEALRRCIETATLEHLFEQKKIRKYFEDWRDDSTLAAAYSHASEWQAKGGRTPLGKAKR
jgi:hypothetical protein